MAEPASVVMHDADRVSRSSASDGQDFSRLVDLKGLAKLPEFDGTDASWPDWKIRFEALIGLMGMESALKEARTVVPDEDLLPDRDKRMSSTLWSIMAQILHGRAYSLLKTVKPHFGFTAWNRLWKGYELPDQVPKQMAMLSSLLKPKWINEVGNFMDQFLAWEYALAELEYMSTSLRLTDEVKIAIVMSEAPRAIRHYLQIQPPTAIATYPALRETVQLYLMRGRNFDNRGMPRSTNLGDDAMEVDPLTAVEFGGKGKGKGKSKFRNFGDARVLPAGTGNSKTQQQQQQQKQRQQSTSVSTQKFGQWPQRRGQQQQQQQQSSQQWQQSQQRQQQQQQPQQQQRTEQWQWRPSKGTGKGFKGVCFKCGMVGHRARNWRTVAEVEFEETQN